MFGLTKSLALALAAFSLSALASPHATDARRHHALAARHAAPEPVPAPVAAPEPIAVEERAPLSSDKRMVRRNKKRASGRCKTRSSSASSTAAPSSSTPASSSVAATSSDAATIVNVAPVPSLSSSSFEEASSSPTSSKHSEAPSSTHTSQVAPTTNAKPTTTKQQETTTKASATKTSSAASSTFTQSFLIGTQTGQGTFYATGLGACGITNTDTDYIAAVSHLLFDTFPGYNGVNPNNNPICNKKVTATYKGKSVSVTITDRCTGCALTDLDFSPSAFDQLADESVGRLSGMTWVWDDL